MQDRLPDNWKQLMWHIGLAAPEYGYQNRFQANCFVLFFNSSFSILQLIGLNLSKQSLIINAESTGYLAFIPFCFS